MHATEARLGDARQAYQEEQTKGLLYQTLVDIKIKMNKAQGNDNDVDNDDDKDKEDCKPTAQEKKQAKEAQNTSDSDNIGPMKKKRKKEAFS